MTRITIRLVTQVVRTDTRQHSGLGVLHENVNSTIRISCNQVTRCARKRHITAV